MHVFKIMFTVTMNYVPFEPYNDKWLAFWCANFTANTLKSCDVYMWHVASYGTICTILKSEKHPWKSVIFGKSIAQSISYVKSMC